MSASFEWDEAKNQLNQKTHGVAFETAQFAFDDPKRIIIRDLEHEKGEKQFFCLGQVEAKILTVRFSFRRKKIRIYGPLTGGKGGSVMSRKTDYVDGRLRLGERVKDFLPPPSQLVKREKTVKITLELTEDSIAFFKREAAKHSVPYQRMLRGLIDLYTKQHEPAR